jgi:hypothetical protein
MDARSFRASAACFLGHSFEAHATEIEMYVVVHCVASCACSCTVGGLLVPMLAVGSINRSVYVCMLKNGRREMLQWHFYSMSIDVKAVQVY